jgi:hypothetical protein
MITRPARNSAHRWLPMARPNSRCCLDRAAVVRSGARRCGQWACIVRPEHYLLLTRCYLTIIERAACLGHCEESVGCLDHGCGPRVDGVDDLGVIDSARFAASASLIRSPARQMPPRGSGVSQAIRCLACGTYHGDDLLDCRRIWRMPLRQARKRVLVVVIRMRSQPVKSVFGVALGDRF